MTIIDYEEFSLNHCRKSITSVLAMSVAICIMASTLFILEDRFVFFTILSVYDFVFESIAFIRSFVSDILRSGLDIFELRLEVDLVTSGVFDTALVLSSEFLGDVEMLKKIIRVFIITAIPFFSHL